MNEKELKFNIGEPVTSASHDTAAIDIVKDEDRNRRKSFMKLLVVGFMLIVVVVFGALGWFATNRNVSAGDMGMKTAGAPFEIESFGAAPQEYISLFNMTDVTYSEGARQGETNSYRTGTSDKIWWRLDASDENEFSAGFRPGASGQLEFNIIPNGTDALTVNCKFNIRAFTSVQNETTNSIEAINEVNPSSPDLQKNAKEYINGHILFFSGRNVDQSGHEIYTGFIGTDGFNVSVPSGGEAHNVKIYWKWINTFDQIFLKTSDNYFDYPLIADDNNTDRDALVEFIKNGSEKLFAGLDDSTVTSIGSISYSDDHSRTEFLSKLNEGYNAADQIIGVNLQYYLIEMTATAASGS